MTTATVRTGPAGNPAPERSGAEIQGGARPRLDHVDAVRPVKQLGVVSTHSVTQFAPAASLVGGAALTLLHVSREAFLFVSACMLTYANPDLARISWRRFVRRRAATIAVPYLCWTLIYWISLMTFPPVPAHRGLGLLVHMLLTGYYQLYYLLVIAEFYVLFPLALLLLRATRRHPLRLLAGSAGLQVVCTGLMHWNELPYWMEGYWGTREVLSYQLYLIGGCLAAAHLVPFERWLTTHWRAVIAGTLVAAGLAEGWYLLAARHDVGWLGAAGDPLQPVVVPFNVGAILCLYLLGTALVDRRRSVRFRQWVRRGSDNSYGIFLGHTLILSVLVHLDWANLTRTVPWPVVVAGAVVIAYSSTWCITAALARTPLAGPLTGQRQIRRTPVAEVAAERGSTPISCDGRPTEAPRIRS